MTIGRNTAVTIAAFAAGAALLLAGGDYVKAVLFGACVNVAMAGSYNLLSGFGGKISLGHGLFFGLGAYGCGLALVAGLHPAFALTLGALCALCGAALLGPVVLPLTDTSFAAVSLGVVMVADQAAAGWEKVTGGSAGLVLPFMPNPGITAAGALLLAFAVVVVSQRIAKSRLGYGLRALAGTEAAAASCGVNSLRIRLSAFLLGALPAGLAGGLGALHLSYVSPSSAFGLETTLTPVVAVMVGGPSTVWGPVLGAVLLTLWQETLWTYMDRFPLMAYGATILAAGLFLPGGIAGVVKRRGS